MTRQELDSSTAGNPQSLIFYLVSDLTYVRRAARSSCGCNKLADVRTLIFVESKGIFSFLLESEVESEVFSYLKYKTQEASSIDNPTGVNNHDFGALIRRTTPLWFAPAASMACCGSKTNTAP